MYKVIGQSEDCYRLSFDPSHAIYKAHFPGNPITPGVCLLEVVGKLAEQKTGRKLRFIRAKNIKFLSALNPRNTPQADFKLNINTKLHHVEVQAIIETTEGVVAKMTTYYE